MDSKTSTVEGSTISVADPVIPAAVPDDQQDLHAGADRVSLAALILAVLGAAFLWFHTLDALPVFDDEAIAVWYAQVAGYPHGVTDLFGSFDYAVPPLFVWLAAIAQHLSSDRLLASRTVSVLCGLATMPALWWLAWQLYRDRIIAIVATALFAICPYELFFGRMALLDPLVQLLGVLIAIQSVRMFRRKEIPMGQAVLLGVLLGLAQLSKGISLFFWVLPLLAWFFFGPERRLERLIRPMIPATGVAVALYLVILASGTIRNLFRPFFTAIKYSVGTPYPGYYSTHQSMSPFTTVHLNFDAWLIWQQTFMGWALLVSLVAIAALAIVRSDSADRFLAVWLFLPLIVMLFAKVYTSRYVLFTVAIQVLLVSRIGVLGGRFVWSVVEARARLKPAGQPASRTMPRAALALVTGVLVIAGAVYTVAFDASRDRLVVTNPAALSLAGDDQWQYISGWPAGYGLDQVERYVTRQASRGQTTVIAESRHQPIDALLFGLTGVPHVRVVPLSLTKPLPRVVARAPRVLAVLDLGKDDVVGFQARHLGWKMVLQTTKPGGSPGFVVLAHS